MVAIGFDRVQGSRYYSPVGNIGYTWRPEE